MADIVDPTPVAPTMRSNGEAYLPVYSPKDAALSSLRAIVTPTLPGRQQDTASPSEGFLSDVGAAFSATFARENWIAGAINAGLENDPTAGENNFNPYTWLKGNMDAATLRQMEPHISAGLFEDAQNGKDVQRIAASLSREERLRKDADRSTIGSLTGGVAALALDPLSYVGAGWALRGASGASRVSRLALQGGLSGAAQEGILHGIQDLRDLHESMFAVGFGAIGAGGLGALIEAAGKAAPAAARGLTNVADALDRAALAGGRESAPSVVDAILRDAGAATTHNAPFDVGAVAPVKANGGGIGGAIQSGADAVLGRFSPISQMLGATANGARNIALRLAEIGPTMLTDRAGNLVAAPTSANVLRDLHLARWLEEPIAAAKSDLLALNRSLAGTGVKKISPADYYDVMARSLDGRLEHEVGEAFRNKMIAAYGDDGARQMFDAAKGSAQRIHDVNTNQIEPELIKNGYLRDNVRLEQAEEKLATMRAARDAEVEKLREQLAMANATSRRGTEAAPEAAAAYEKLKAQLAERQEAWRQDIEPWQAARDEQIAKPEPMGKDYGYAQLYDRSGLAMNENAFREMLLLKFATVPYEGWLREVHGLSPDQFAKLATENPARHQEITLAWTGDEHLVNIERAEARLAAAQQRFDLAKADVHRVSYYAGAADKNLAGSTRALAAAERARRVALRDLKRAEKEAADLQVRAFKDAAEAARTNTLSRQMAEVLDRPDVGEKELADAIAKGARVAPVRNRAMQDPVTTALENASPGTLSNAGDVARAERSAATTADKAAVDPLVAPPAPEGVVTNRVSKLEGKIAEMERKMASLDTEIGNISARVSEIDEALDAFGKAHAARKSARGAINDSLAQANKARNLSAKNIAQLKKQLTTAKGQSGLSSTVDGIIDSLLKDGHIPRSGDDPLNAARATTETGRVKQRQINYTPEEREQLTSMGVLRQDLPGILDTSTKSLAGHLSIREALGIGSAGGRYQSWADVVDAVEAEYRQMRADAVGKDKVRVETERQMAMRNIALFRDRLTGADLTGVANKDTVFYWGTSKAKQLALVNYLPGFGIASLTDFAGAVLNHRLGGLMRAAIQNWSGALNGASKAQLAALVQAAELTSHSTRDFSAMRGEELSQTMGIGVRGSMRHTVTASIDEVAGRVQNAAAWVSFLPQMSHFIRTTVAIDAMNGLGDRVGRFVSLNARDKGHLMTLGLDAEKAGRLDRFLSQHGTRNEGGLFEPNVDLWGTSAEAKAAARDLDIAMMREVSFSTPTHGVGDVPRFLSTHLGSMLMQFQSFAFTAYTRLIAPMIQKAAYTHDVRMIGVLVTMLGMGSVTVAARDMLVGKNPLERWAPDKIGQTMYDVVDRGGFLGWMAPYSSALLRFAGMQGSSVAYRQNDKLLVNLLGAQVAQVNNVGRALGSAKGYLSGEVPGDKAAKDAARISPFGMYARLFTHLLSD